MKNKQNIKYGKKDHLPKDFDPKSAKVRISLMIDGDLLQAYRDAAKHTHHGEYQTLMKEKLREALVGQVSPELKKALESMVDDLLNKKLAQIKSETTKSKKVA
jgi:uncharacterized protein (DUF4415 family)